MAIKLRGGGGKVLMARPLREDLCFLRLPLPHTGCFIKTFLLLFNLKFIKKYLPHIIFYFTYKRAKLNSYRLLHSFFLFSVFFSKVIKNKNPRVFEEIAITLYFCKKILLCRNKYLIHDFTNIFEN